MKFLVTYQPNVATKTSAASTLKERGRAGLRPGSTPKHCHIRSLAVPRRGTRTRQLTIDTALDTVSKPSSRGTGVSTVKEKTLCSQHRRDACATRNTCNAAIWMNCSVYFIPGFLDSLQALFYMIIVGLFQTTEV